MKMTNAIPVPHSLTTQNRILIENAIASWSVSTITMDSGNTDPNKMTYDDLPPAYDGETMTTENPPTYEMPHLNEKMNYDNVLDTMIVVCEGMNARYNRFMDEVSNAPDAAVGSYSLFYESRKRVLDQEMRQFAYHVFQAMKMWNRMRREYLCELVSTTTGWSANVDTRVFEASCGNTIRWRNSYSSLTTCLREIRNTPHNIDLSSQMSLINLDS
jgi:hypothetical protein